MQLVVAEPDMTSGEEMACLFAAQKNKHAMKTDSSQFSWRVEIGRSANPDSRAWENIHWDF